MRYIAAVVCAGLSLSTPGCVSNETGADLLPTDPEISEPAPLPGVGHQLTQAVDASQRFISWREHLIDRGVEGGITLSGSDGLVMADVDLDGVEDIVSVHESDTTYDGQPDGYVRIAFGSADPDEWQNVTLVKGAEAGAPEDVDVADVNGDGYPDVIVAAELAHLLYLQNPGEGARTGKWPRLVLPMTRDRGSYIRAFFADFDADGTPEAVAPNKGAQNPQAADFRVKTPVSVFKVIGDPLLAAGWREIELGRYSVPQNSEPVDIDRDGDLDIVVGSRGERRLILFENVSATELEFVEHEVHIDNAFAAGFNLTYADINADGRLDIVAATNIGLAWLAQPPTLDGTWQAHRIGDLRPDSVTGIALADINGDKRPDVMVGSYSRGPRDRDGEVTVADRLGRIAWFASPADVELTWPRHDISRRVRGMFDKFIPRDMDKDGDLDFVGTRGNSAPYDGVFWLEQVRTDQPVAVFRSARRSESREMALPDESPVKN